MHDATAHSGKISQAGLTLLELIIACAILAILASAAVPMARFTVKRKKEAELHRDLREMRNAIDAYKDAADRHLIRVEADTDGYPPDLQTLVQGVDIVPQGGAGTSAATVAQQSGSATAPFGSSLSGTGKSGDQSSGQSGGEAIRHVRFLRRIPVDPMTGRADWGLRAVQDPPDSTSWGGQDVFDVYSLSDGTAINGTRYSSW